MPLMTRSVIIRAGSWDGGIRRETSEVLIVIWILPIAVVLLVFWVIGLYNTLVQLRKRCDNGWAQIDVQLKRRYDLIPNLVETAKGLSLIHI